ncbi:MAG TPA: anti-sigma factor [Ilumatobacteraceae bacterium]|nr:anti-sigma factor [Ilumatobacteraceae bacterium]
MVAGRGTSTLTTFDSGWRIVLDADGLVRRGGGESYEAWLRDAEVVLVSIGTFNEGDHVVLRAGGAARVLDDNGHT